VRRRTLLASALAAAGASSSLSWVTHASQEVMMVTNVTGLYAVRVGRVAVPLSTQDVMAEVRRWPGKIAVGGGRFSMGGQTAIEGGLHLDMRQMDQVVWFRPQEMAVRVQAGLRWRDLQDILDRENLSVRTMQSYADFTVGGSVSVNAHGRYVGHGPISHSVRALRLVLADGSVVDASRKVEPEIFGAALGGFGAIGVITEVELSLDRNSKLERSIAHVQVADYPGYFKRKIEADATCVLHNADLMPPLFNVAIAVSWKLTDKPLTITDRLTARNQSYRVDRAAIWAMTTLPKGDKLQAKVVRPALLRQSAVVWRNHEASLDVQSLEPASRAVSTYALQEYFVPPRRFQPFARTLVQVLRRWDAQVLNVSVRHSPADADALMAWAREEVFSFVLYYKQGVDSKSVATVGNWTRELIAAAIEHEGTYYLPYQLHATGAQFDAAYPRKSQFAATKRRVDPENRLTNELWKRYL
jgi:FAD/FMN-containing dehydrogenase